MIVIDANIAIKWYVNQSGSIEANELAASNEILIAPELILAEAGNAFWLYVKNGMYSQASAHEAMAKLAHRLNEVIPLSDLIEQALAIAIKLNHSIYDCFYLALAEREKATLVTADRKLAGIAEKLDTVKVQFLGKT